MIEANHFLDLDTNESFVVQDDDRLGGFKRLDTGVYLAVIKHAYFSVSKNGAKVLNVRFQVAVDGSDKPHEIDKQMYYTNNQGSVKNSKGDGYTYGYNQAESLCQLASGKAFKDQASKQIILELRNFELKQDVPTQVWALTELTGKQVQLGIQNKVGNKQVNTAPAGQPDKYEDTADKREWNEVAKFFAKDGRTFSEIKEGKTAEFKTKWVEEFGGKIIGKYNDKATATTGTAGAPSGASAPTGGKSIFNT